MTLLQKKIFYDSNFILISTKYKSNEVDEIKKIINFSKQYDKKIILTTNGPVFEYTDYLSIIDNFYLDNKRLPNLDEIILLEKKYFTSLSDQTENVINKKIIEISKNLNIKLLKKFDLLCNSKLKRCEFLTPDKDKIIFDSSHYSLKGAKYIGKKIFNSNWLNLN